MNDLPLSSGIVPTSLTRRQALKRAGGGFGTLALAGLLSGTGKLSAAAGSSADAARFTPRAKRVIFLFMNGAPSHIDTFDSKPALRVHAGEKPSGRKYPSKAGGYMPSPFEFRPHGESGVVMSELFPHLSTCADDLCILRSMYTDNANHEPGLLMMHSGNQQPIRPSLGAWASYGLGTENENLPAFVVLSPGRPVVGPQLWSSGFLPGEHQGTAVDTNNLEVEKLLANIRHPFRTRAEQLRQLELLREINRRHRLQRPEDAHLESEIHAMELAFNMQREAAVAFDVSREPSWVRERYGPSVFGQSCLLARKLSESGVRFVQVYYVTKSGKQPWDTHSDNDNQHRRLCADADRAAAALLTELKERGLLDETLVIWGGEFGRTPYSEINKNKKTKPGRDHHGTGFSMFLAGGGVKGGLMYGATDEFGMHAVEDRMHVHDLHATILRLLGLDHEKLTYRYSGRDFRLTDVHGRVAEKVLA